MTIGNPMPDLTPQQLLERLIEQLEEIRRSADYTMASGNALRHARACEQWLSLHEERLAKRASDG